jgi:hypothetical protein
MVMVQLPFEMEFVSDGRRYSILTGRQPALLRRRRQISVSLPLFLARRTSGLATRKCAAQHGQHLPGRSISNYQMREYRVKDRLGWAYLPV